MKRKTERLLRNLLQFVDKQLDELAAQEDSPEDEFASEPASTPIRRVEAKLDDLALAIEFELQLELIRTTGTRTPLTGDALETATQSTSLGRQRNGAASAAVHKLSPFQKKVDQWFIDHRALTIARPRRAMMRMAILLSADF